MTIKISNFLFTLMELFLNTFYLFWFKINTVINKMQ